MGGTASSELAGNTANCEHACGVRAPTAADSMCAKVTQSKHECMWHATERATADVAVVQRRHRLCVQRGGMRELVPRGEPSGGGSPLWRRQGNPDADSTGAPCTLKMACLYIPTLTSAEPGLSVLVSPLKSLQFDSIRFDSIPLCPATLTRLDKDFVNSYDFLVISRTSS